MSPVSLFYYVSNSTCFQFTFNVIFAVSTITCIHSNFNAFSHFFFSGSFSMFFHAFAITHVENNKVLEYNQMVNTKLLIMLDCKQLNI